MPYICIEYRLFHIFDNHIYKDKESCNFIPMFPLNGPQGLSNTILYILKKGENNLNSSIEIG